MFYQKKHQLDIDFEPMSGTPLSARKRIQFNMFVFPIEKVKTMKTFATALMPLFWIEESITLPKKFLAQVKLLFTVLIAVKYVFENMYLYLYMKFFFSGSVVILVTRHFRSNIEIY